MLTQRQFAMTLTSPLLRALETCERSGLEGIVNDDLREWDYGSYEGRTTKEIRRELPDWTLWWGAVPGGERIDKVAARADRVITRIERVDGHLAVFSHGHFLRVLAARWLGLPPADGRLLGLDTWTLNVLGTERETHVIRMWNGFPLAEPG